MMGKAETFHRVLSGSRTTNRLVSSGRRTPRTNLRAQNTSCSICEEQLSTCFLEKKTPALKRSRSRLEAKMIPLLNRSRVLNNGRADSNCSLDLTPNKNEEDKSYRTIVVR